MSAVFANAIALGAAELADLSDLLTIDQIEAGRDRFIFSITNIKSDYLINWHHSMLADVLERVQSGEITRLMVFMPPRTGKSEQVSRQFPAWCLGKNPDEKIIACSYSATLAGDMGMDVQNIMSTDEYQAMFDTRLKSTATSIKKGRKIKETNLRFDVANGSGYYMGAGVGGPITGRGFSLGIIDDPDKNREEADSETRQRRNWQWYTSTFYTRREGKMSSGGCDRIILCTTLWNENGLAGKILREAEKTGEVWHIIRFPAIAENEDAGIYSSSPEFVDPREPGEPLWREKFDLPDLAIIRRQSSRDWTSLQQQRPAPDKGNILLRRWWKRYKVLPREYAVKTFSLDCAFDKSEDSSFVVLQLWHRYGPDHYLIRQWRKRMDYRETKAVCITAFDEHQDVRTKLVEKKANGAAIINELSEKFSGLVPIEPKGSKVSRVWAVQGIAEGGNVYLPEDQTGIDEYTVDGWVDQFIAEMSGFPNASNDDQVDCMTQYLEHGGQSGVTFLKELTAGF